MSTPAAAEYPSNQVITPQVMTPFSTQRVNWAGHRVSMGPASDLLTALSSSEKDLFVSTFQDSLPSFSSLEKTEKRVVVLHKREGVKVAFALSPSAASTHTSRFNQKEHAKSKSEVLASALFSFLIDSDSESSKEMREFNFDVGHILYAISSLFSFSNRSQLFFLGNIIKCEVTQGLLSLFREMLSDDIHLSLETAGLELACPSHAMYRGLSGKEKNGILFLEVLHKELVKAGLTIGTDVQESGLSSAYYLIFTECIKGSGKLPTYEEFLTIVSTPVAEEASTK